jgi:signal transduction histidine kinase/CheY-like chemotaxis protein
MKFRFSFLLLIILLLTTNAFAQKGINPTTDLKKLLNKSRNLYEGLNFQRSLIVADLVLKKSLEQKNDSMIAYSYDMFGRNFSELYGADKSVESYKKGLAYASKARNLYIQKMLCNNIANVLCFDKKEFKEGIYYFKKALLYNENSNQFKENIIVKANIAWAYFEWGKFKEGLPYLELVTTKVNELGEDYGDEESIMIVYMINGMYYNHINKDELSKEYFLKAINISENQDFLNKVYLYEEYAKFLTKSGDHKNALENYKKFHALRQKIYKEKKFDAINITALQTQLQEYKKEIKISEQRNISQAEKLKNARVIETLGFFLILTLGISLFMLFKNIRLKKENILKLEKINSELKVSNVKAQEATVLKTQFITSITHELRTPLYGVVGIADVLNTDHKNPENEKQLEALKFSANYLMTLVNDVLQMSKIEEGKVTLDEDVFDLREAVFALKNAMLYIANNNNVTLTIAIDPDIPNRIIGDSQKLIQILINLVTNALKFSLNGTVIVSIQLEKTINNKSYIQFQVIDNGIGIAIENQSKIFDNFTQIKQEKQEFEGSGLGLSIVKKLISLFDSDITLLSTLGKGSTFTFSIAFENSNEIYPDTVPINYESIASKNLKILVVDDNRINQLVTKKIIERENHTCEIVPNGFEALKSIEKSDFDIVLMDINMPDMDGYQATEKIRALKKDQIIIALTASAREQVTDNVVAAGMNDLIIKPFRSEDFFKVVYKLL